MIEELEKEYEEFQKIFDVLATNTKANINKKLGVVEDESKKTEKLLELVKAEIESRLSKLNNLKENSKIKELQTKLEKCKITNEWNKYNTAYEKMHLDYYLYQLHRYYKEDLDSLNECINKILDSFKKVEINLTVEDFNTNSYAQEYMGKLLNKTSKEELVKCFEDNYWKCPEIIQALEINFKIIYLKYEDKIEKYYEKRREEYEKANKEEEAYDLRKKIAQELNLTIAQDQYSVFEKFKNKEYSIDKYTESEIEKIKDLYFNDTNYDLDKTDKILFEFCMILDYSPFLSDMKERLSKKEEYKNVKTTALKEINTLIGNLNKLNSKKNSKSIFNRKPKNNEKYLFEYKTILNDLITKFDEYDEVSFNNSLYETLSTDSTILEVLSLISSNYLYFVKKSKEVDENVDINVVVNDFEKLKDKINDNDFSILNSIALLDEKQMKQVISNKFILEGINIQIEDLTTDNLNKTVENIHTLINYENIKKSKINLDDVRLYLEMERL